MKPKSIVAAALVCAAAYTAIQFGTLIISTNRVNIKGRTLLKAGRLIRAFLTYRENHKHFAPVFRNSDEVTGILLATSQKNISSSSSVGFSSNESREISAVSRMATWNPTLSGRIMGQTPKWVFYFPITNAQFIITFENGTISIVTAAELITDIQ